MGFFPVERKVHTEIPVGERPEPAGAFPRRRADSDSPPRWPGSYALLSKMLIRVDVCSVSKNADKY